MQSGRDLRVTVPIRERYYEDDVVKTTLTCMPQVLSVHAQIRTVSAIYRSVQRQVFILL
jgi:hypothetical protein